MKNQPPKFYQDFVEKYPAIAEAYNQLSDAVHKQGPLDDRTRALVKIAISGTAKLEGGFHAHVRKARALGLTKEEIQQVAFLALPTLGFPTMMMWLSWIDDVFEK